MYICVWFASERPESKIRDTNWNWPIISFSWTMVCLRLLPLLLCGISITQLSGSHRTKFRFRTNVDAHTHVVILDAIETISFLWCHMKLAKSYSNDVVSSKHSVECGSKISMVITDGQKRNRKKVLAKTKILCSLNIHGSIKIYVSKIFRKKSNFWININAWINLIVIFHQKREEETVNHHWRVLARNLSIV